MKIKGILVFLKILKLNLYRGSKLRAIESLRFKLRVFKVWGYFKTSESSEDFVKFLFFFYFFFFFIMSLFM
jgi:hypothetical protein